MSPEAALQLAYDWALRGVPAFPIAISWDDEKHATNKRPLTPHGHLDAEADRGTVLRLFQNAYRLQPGEELAVGLWPGAADRVVLDVDDKGAHRGSDELDALESEHGRLPDHPVVPTPSGGTHRWFAKPSGVHVGDADLAPGINIRASTGWVVAPGVFTTWGAWEVEELGLPVEEAPLWPEWLAAKLTGGANGQANGQGKKEHWRKLDRDALDPRDRAALEALEALGGHSPYLGGDGAVLVTRPGKGMGASASIGFIGPGIVKVFTDGWPRLEKRIYDGDELATLAGGGATEDGSSSEGGQGAGQAGEDNTSTWKPIDLTDAYLHGDLEPAWTWPRSDGVNLIYRARLHSFHGASESCKSLAAQSITADELLAGRNVLYVDFEDDDRGMAARMRAFRVPLDVAQEHLVYIRPDEPLRDRQGRVTRGGADFDRLLAGRKFDLAVIDGVTEAMVTEGLKMLDNDDVAQWLRVLPKKLTAAGTGVIVVDHVTKAHDSSSRFAIGGQHKLAGLTGAGYLFEVIKPLTRATGSEVQYGKVRITGTKDRPAHIRARSEPGPTPGTFKAGVIHFEAFGDGSISMTVQPERAHDEDGELRDQALKILPYLELYPGASQTRIELGVEGRSETIRRALVWAAGQGWIDVDPKGTGHAHTLTAAGLDELDRSRRL